MKMITLWVLMMFLWNHLSAQKFENLALTPPMGWNSWNKFGCEKVNEEVIKEMADAMVKSGLADAGYKYIVIDDCWQISRDGDGNIQADPEKFPSGIKALADYVHSKGLKFGIYSCAGDKTCAGRPGSRGHEFQDARTYASWGVDYLKYDWCYNGKQNAEAAYTTMRDALFAAKRPVVFSICEWGTNEPWLWGKNVGHLWRTTQDIKPCSDCVFRTGAPLGWINIMEKQVPLSQYAGPGHWNDPDMLEVGNGHLSFHENRSHFTMWCMMSAPLMLGNDLSGMPGEILQIVSNREVIAIDQDPLGKQAYRFITDEGIDVWVKPLSREKYAIAFLNKHKEQNDLYFDWKWRGKCFFANSGDLSDYTLYNVWDKKDDGTTIKPIETTLAGREVLLLIASKR